MELEVSEQQKHNGTTSLFLNGTHLDLMEMNQTSEGGMQGMEETGMEERDMEGGASQQNAIVITAATVVPEFPLSLTLGTAIGFSMIVFIFSQKRRFSL
jgi:hypothetical protein